MLVGGIKLSTIFSLVVDGEEIVWNVSTMKADAQRGLFGPPITLPISILPPTNYENINAYKVKRLKRKGARHALDIPVLSIGGGEPGHIYCFVDGNHRLVARVELGLTDFRTFICPHEMERRYRMSAADLAGALRL